ncbi:MAG: class I SAM-dependent rRNA methyltransferase [bacterium]
MKHPQVHLQRGRHKRVQAGHPWVFSNEVRELEGSTPEAGALVEVLGADGRFLGAGLYHPGSLIAVRLLTRERAPISLDSEFFADRIRVAQARRCRALGERQIAPPAAYRLCHGEADGLPGVVIDRYGDVLVTQIACLGLDQRKAHLFDALEEVFSPAAIVERNDTVWRDQEGLPRQSGVARGELPEALSFVEHDLTYQVDVLAGQKTGWFLDQRDHRLAVRPFAAGSRVLDLCCYEGGFTLNALAAGARSVDAVDASQAALDRLAANAGRNGLTAGLETHCADVMDLATGGPPGGAPFELIVLDPPSFTRSRKAVPRARRAYRKLNEAALRWLAPGGVLATASCSHHLYEDTFLQLLQEAAVLASRAARVLYRGFQPPDHPVLLAMPETRYLKFFVLQVD